MPKIKKTTALLVLVVLFSVLFFLLIPAIPQPLAYHQFSDQRAFFGVPHFWNVLSNIPFLLVGTAGLFYLHRRQLAINWESGYPSPVWFFCGVLLTAFGSAWYHLAPGNSTLVWDRLPMTLSFMPLFTILLSDYLAAGIERKLLYPLLIVGVGSVVYWYFTEQQGRGDLRWYALVQFLPMLLMVPLVLFSRARYSHGHLYLWMFVYYLLAKITEYYDAQIYDLLGEQMAGHALKHLFASVATATMLLMLIKRQPLIRNN